jgi:isocitrate/isopropylmalate dehydrogenase
MKGADILFVRENVEDLYASIEHRLSRNYPQALRHQTPEGCELICRAAFEVGLRDGRKKVTALEKPNILKITGGLFKEVFLKVAKDYTKEKLGERALEANFMIIDDGLAAIAATPEKFDVVVTTNMFGDIGSDIAAKVTGGVGLVSSNNINPSNPLAVSMFETMGGTADDIAGQNKANPVALIDAAAEMLIHIGGSDNFTAAELIKAAVLEVLADGFYVGDIKKGPYQESKGKEKLGTQEFTDKIVEKIHELRRIQEAHPDKSIKQIAVERAHGDIRPLFDRVLRSYLQYARENEPGGAQWLHSVIRNSPPNPVRARARIVGFDLFVDDSGVRPTFAPDGSINRTESRIDPIVSEEFKKLSGLQITSLFDEGRAGSLQSVRSFGQYSARVLKNYLEVYPEKGDYPLGKVLVEMGFTEEFSGRFSADLQQQSFKLGVEALENFDKQSIKLLQSFYRARARELEPILKTNGFRLARVTSRGTEIYPTMCDFEKRDVDRFRVEVDPSGHLAQEQYNHVLLQEKISIVQMEIVRKGWIISETMLNRSFIDGEGASQGKEVSGVSVPYARNLGKNYSGFGVG